MPFEDAGQHFRDILESIQHIQRFIGEMTLAEYLEDQKTRSAVERQLQIITEAAYRLGEEGSSLCPGPDWKGLRGMGNILRHAYHRVDDRLVWGTVHEDLPLIREAVARIVESGFSNPGTTIA